MTRLLRNAALITAILCGPGSSDGWSKKDINSRAGTSAFPFLKINLGARAVGMGGAFTGLADDESALYYNPAGIATLEGRRFIAGYHNYFVDIQSGFLGYINRLNDNISFGGWASYLNYGDFVETDGTGEIIGDFSGGDLLAAFTIAYRQNHNITFGGTIKLIYERLHEYTSTGLAADIGVRYAGDRERYGAGLMIQNLGKQLSALNEETYRLPLTFRGGVFVRPREFPLTIAGDLIVPVDNDPVVAIGADYYEFRPFYARIGWDSFGSNYRGAESDDSWAGLSLGIGFDYQHLHISYSYSPSADLGESHRVTLTGGL
ncbi:MAG: PorV/PorQ family protein [Candidatus Zixiibacteriota bacterium]